MRALGLLLALTIPNMALGQRAAPQLDDAEVPPGLERRYLPPPRPMLLLPVPAPLPVDPPQYRLERRYGLMVAGACVFGVPEGLTGLAAGLTREWRLAIPVAGPFIEMGSAINDSKSSPLALFAAALLAVDGLVQTAGVAMLVGGAATKKKVWVPRPFYFAPSAIPGSAAIVAIGRF
jgi:hypothetical protein